MGQLYAELVEDEAYWDPSFEPPFPDWNITIDNHGTAANVTVPLSICRVNFRYTLQPWTRAPCWLECRSRRIGRGWSWNRGAAARPSIFAPDSELVQLALEITSPAGSNFGSRIAPTPASLASLFRCIVVGPGDLRQAHTVNEWVSVEQLHQSVDLYLKFIQAVCR